LNKALLNLKNKAIIDCVHQRLFFGDDCMDDSNESNIHVYDEGTCQVSIGQPRTKK